MSGLQYSELLAERNRLLSERDQLLKENKQLKEKVARMESKSANDANEHHDEKKAIATPSLNSAMFRLSPEEKEALFKSIFKGREDVFARRWYSAKTKKSGYQPVCIREWDHHYCDKKKHKCTECPNRMFAPLSYEHIYKHLAGKDEYCRDVVGVYVILQDDTCSFLCADFDDKDSKHGYKQDVKAYTQMCKELNIPAYIERSRSGNGAHVWIFFKNPIPAYKARKLGNIILTEAMNRNGRLELNSYDRFLPNQDHLPKGGFGNLVALPLQGQARRKGNSVFVDEEFMPFPDQWEYLLGIKKVSEQDVNQLTYKYGLSADIGEFSKSNESKPWEAPAALGVQSSDFKSGLEVIKSNMLYIPIRSMSARALNYLKRIAAFKNPEFYKKQAMRLSTFDTPRIITCSEQTDDYVELPIGCEDTLRKLLDDNHAQYKFIDKTNHGKPISIRFKGKLRDGQQKAVKSLATHDNGVLSAITAFGKTVVAIGLIAEKKVNTLILVHNNALLDQWRQRLNAFLEIDETLEFTKGRDKKKDNSPIGYLASNRNNLHSIIDIALMQSCITDSEVKPFVRNYGMVIVDECHHVSAITFEHVMKFANARYIYGLTATPIRKDGHQPIIFMQCGPIRYNTNAKEQIASQNFERLLIPRFTTYHNLTGEEQGYTPMMQLLASDKVRNQQIVSDIKRSLEEGRSPIVLTTLRSHVETLSEKLCPLCKNIISLVGSNSVKTKRDDLERLASIPKDESLVIVAIGKYIGEGFDYPRLDTLFMALPVSWKGIVAQYAGRLHRDYEGKKDVRVYDYVDIRVPLCESMYRKRLKGYAAIGYKSIGDVSCSMESYKASAIYNGYSYINNFIEDLGKTRKSIVLSCPRITRTQQLTIKQLYELVLHGIRVVIFTRNKNYETETLSSHGVDIHFDEKLNLQCTILDKSTVWYGSVSYLGYNTKEDNAVRLYDPSIAKNLIDVLYDRNVGVDLFH